MGEFKRPLREEKFPDFLRKPREFSSLGTFVYNSNINVDNKLMSSVIDANLMISSSFIK